VLSNSSLDGQVLISMLDRALVLANVETTRGNNLQSPRFLSSYTGKFLHRLIFLQISDRLGAPLFL
jgi:hypothetical protein